jgi:putative endonuclease
MSYFVYIIQSTTSGKWYIGYSSELKTRIQNHNAGFNASTKNRGPWVLIFVREFTSKMDALELERYLKQTRNKEYIRKHFSEHFLKGDPEAAPRFVGLLNTVVQLL